MHNQQEGNHVRCWKFSQLPRASEIMDPRGEPTNTTLLNQHNP